MPGTAGNENKIPLHTHSPHPTPPTNLCNEPPPFPVLSPPHLPTYPFRYAWFKYYTLCESFNKNLTDEEKTTMASAVLLAALAIPTIAGEDSDSADMAEKAIDESTASAALLKNQHMAGLLGFHSNPSRSGLMSDLNARGLKDLATPEVRALYENLEVKFHPLELVAKVKANLVDIEAASAKAAAEAEAAEAKALAECDDEEEAKVGQLGGSISGHTGAGAMALADLGKFAQPLTRLVVLRLLKQLATVYHSVKIDHFLNLVKPLGVQRDAVRFILIFDELITSLISDAVY